MTETERSGVSISAALAANARRMAWQIEQPPAESAAAVKAAGDAGRGRSIKQRMRPLVAMIYRAIRPVLRPVAFRLRAYLLAPLQAERQGSALKAELQSLRNHIDQKWQLQQNELAATTRELELIRESLARTVRAALLDSGLDGSASGSPGRLDRIEQYAYGAARRVAVPGGPGEVLVRTAVGYLLCPASDYPLLATLVDRGELELGTRKLIQRLLRPGETFIDIGANVGMHTLAAAIAMQARGRIIAFEPHPTTCELLRKSLLLNGFARMAETHQAAVSNREGVLPLFLGPTSGHHSLYPLGGDVGSTGAMVDVPLVRIDDIISADTRVDLVKIDVEGAELDAIEGACATIERNADVALIVEFGPSHLHRAGHTTGEWLQAFERLGLHFRAIEPMTGALLDWTPGQIESVESINLLFARPTSKAWDRGRSPA
jgi:FkbM family methyltransferase